MSDATRFGAFLLWDPRDYERLLRHVQVKDEPRK